MESNVNMSNKETADYVKNLDFASLILQLENAPSYPMNFAKDAYYGFYLLGKSAGSILHASVGKSPFTEITLQRAHVELALQYILSSTETQAGVFRGKLPLTYTVVEAFLEFVETCENHWDQTQCKLFCDKVNDLVTNIERTRQSQDTLRSTDIFLARQWCRLLRLYSFLRIPHEYLPKDYSFERDLTICERRGIRKEPLAIIRFRVRFYRLTDERALGKLLLLAEEWELFCKDNATNMDPFEYELQVLSILDSDDLYKIGLEWVTLLEHRHPSHYPFRKWHARLLRRSGDFEAALQMILSLMEEAPTDHELFYLASNLQFLLGDFDDARRMGETAIRLNPDDPSSHLAMAFALLYAGAYQESLTSFTRAHLLDENHVDTLRGMAKAKLMLGYAIDAMKDLRQAVRIEPEDAELFYDLADVYFTCGYLEDCVKNCDKCLSLDPEFAPAYVLLGSVEIRLNHDDKAQKFLTKALELEPANPIAMNEMAYLYHLSGNDDDALVLLEKALEVAPDFPDVMCSIATVHYFRSEFETALDYFDRTLALDPAHRGALVGKGNLYLARTDADEALLWFDRALALSSFDEDAIYGRIDALRALGLEQDAFDEMERAAQMGFDDM